MYCLVIPVVLIICLLLACKWAKFSIIPEGLTIPKPKRFKLPKLKRSNNRWSQDDSSDDEDDDDEDDDDEDDDDEDDDDEGSSSDDDDDDDYNF